MIVRLSGPLLASAVLASCRIGFDPVAVAGDAGADARADALPDAEPTPMPIPITVGAEEVLSALTGGGGGGAFTPRRCPAGQLLFGMQGEFYRGTMDDGAGVCHIQLLCTRMALGGDGKVVRDGAPSVVPLEQSEGVGTCDPQEPPELLEAVLCPAESVASGIAFTQSGLFQAPTLLTLECAEIDASGNVTAAQMSNTSGEVIAGAQVEASTRCPEQSLATGIDGSHGVVLDSVQFACSQVSIGG